MSYYYSEYVPVAVRREKALKKMDKLRKAGKKIDPIEPFKGRRIATSFWGKSWCQHLESFSDYNNRLPRGRTYVRNGSVCHLEIKKGEVQAIVSGSELYNLKISVAALKPQQWSAIKTACRGKIGSFIELLQGHISDEVMHIVTDPNQGLFPHPQEISFKCNCPDWADMCKHVAAVMYGIGTRLDSAPELLFKLRGVNYEELIQIDPNNNELAGNNRSRRRRTVQENALEDIFDIELEREDQDLLQKPKALELTGDAIAARRKELGLSQAAFARKVGVSIPSIAKWEKTPGTLKLQSRTRQLLKQAFDQNSA